MILAAGGSSRLGRPKQLLQLGGQTLLRRAAHGAIESRCGRVMAVLGSCAEQLQQELADLPVQIVHNPDWELGIGASIKAAVRAVLADPVPTAAVMIILCDQPLVTAAVLRRLHAAHLRQEKPITACAYAGTIGPPVIVGQEYSSVLLSIPDAQGAKRLWLDHPESLHIEPCPEAAVDVDTWEDYQRVRKIVRTEKGGFEPP